MSKSEQMAFVVLDKLVKAGCFITIENEGSQVCVTVWPRGLAAVHSHYLGKDLMEAIFKTPDPKR